MCFEISVLKCSNTDFYHFFFLAVDEINPFRALDTIERLRTHPKTAGYFKDPSFVEGLGILARDHHALEKWGASAFAKPLSVVVCM